VDDEEIISRIGELVDEEHRLEREHGRAPLSDNDATKLREIEVRLDQCWDLLRQRRARREFGQDPDEAGARAESVVESYRQ
jgi:hypothetical protein